MNIFNYRPVLGRRYDDVAQFVSTTQTQYPDCQIDVMAPNWCKPLLARMPEVCHAIEMPLGHGKFALCERYRLGRHYAINMIWRLCYQTP